MYNNQDQKKTDKKKEPKIYTDYNIFPGKVRLVCESGMYTIVIDRDEAIERAKSEGKNLVQIGYNKGDFPHSICKIIDYGKFLYDQNKKVKNQKKQERLTRVETKEIFFSIRIDDNDMDTKINHAREFISDGNRVKINIKLMRREMDKDDWAVNMINGIVEKMSDVAVVDVPVQRNANIVSCVLRKI